MDWEVDEVERNLFYYQTFGSYFYVCLYCHIVLVDMDWMSVSVTDVRLLINGLFKVATLIHIWVD